MYRKSCLMLSGVFGVFCSNHDLKKTSNDFELLLRGQRGLWFGFFPFVCVFGEVLLLEELLFLSECVPQCSVEAFFKMGR